MYPVSSVRNQNHNAVSGIVAYGPYYPAYVIGNAATGIDWTDPENAQGVENGDYAYCYFFTEGANSAPLRAFDFGMEIPANATIHGIFVEVYRSADTYDFTDWVNSGYGARLMLDAEDNGSHIGDDLGDSSFWSRGDFEWKTYGGEAELWNTVGLTAENLNSSSFGFDTSAVSDNSGGTVMVQAVRMTVWASE